MSVMIDKDTKVIVQGITGKAAMFHTQQMLDYGTKIVAGVTPGKAGQEVHGVPVFNTVADAVKATGATASVIYVPARFAADSILEAVDAELDLVVCITEHIPVLDMVKVRRYMQGKKTRLVGPNCPGLLTSQQSKLGITPGTVSKPGHVGLISRSGTLTYEAAFQLTNAGIGQTTTVGIGGDPVKGTDFIDALQLFKDDPDTYAVLIIGEIGGTAKRTRRSGSRRTCRTSPSPPSSQGVRRLRASAWATPAPSSPAARARRRTKSQRSMRQASPSRTPSPTSARPWSNSSRKRASTTSATPAKQQKNSESPAQCAGDFCMMSMA